MFRSKVFLPVCEFSESDIWERGNLRSIKILTMKLLDTIWLITGGTSELLKNLTALVVVFIFFLRQIPMLYQCSSHMKCVICPPLVAPNRITKLFFSRHSFPISLFGQEQWFESITYSQCLHVLGTQPYTWCTPLWLLTLKYFKSSTSLKECPYRIVVLIFDYITKRFGTKIRLVLVFRYIYFLVYIKYFTPKLP